MSYAVIPQKNPLIDPSSKPADKKKAAIGALVFALILVLVIFWRFFSRLDPIPEPQGVIASFESVEIETGGGGGGGSNESEEKSNNQKQSSSQSKEIETDNNIKSDVNVNKGNDKDAEVKADPGLDFTNFKGDDKANSNSNDGSNNLGPAGPGKGSGKGYGDGSEEGSGTSLCMSNCECANNKWEIDVVEIIAWITVEINEDGSVNSAKFAETGDVKNQKNYTVLNSNIKSQKDKTKKIVLDCFRKRTYKSTGKKYRITQKLVLKKV